MHLYNMYRLVINFLTKIQENKSKMLKNVNMKYFSELSRVFSTLQLSLMYFIYMSKTLKNVLVK